MSDQPKKFWTTEDLMDAVERTIAEMSLQDKARLRVDLREKFGLPAVPEPDAYMN